jgi:hypothetical protein
MKQLMQMSGRSVQHAGIAGKLPALPPHLPLPAQALHLVILSIIYQVQLTACPSYTRYRLSIIYQVQLTSLSII